LHRDVTNQTNQSAENVCYTEELATGVLSEIRNREFRLFSPIASVHNTICVGMNWPGIGIVSASYNLSKSDNLDNGNTTWTVGVIATTLSVDQRSIDKLQHAPRVNISSFTERTNDYDQLKRDRSRYGDGSDSGDLFDMLTRFQFRRQLVLTFGNADQKKDTQKLWDTVEPSFNVGLPVGSFDDFNIQINTFNRWFQKLRLPLKEWFVIRFKTVELQRLERARRLLEAICQGFIKVLEELKEANPSNQEEDVQIVGELTLKERNDAGFAGAVDLDPSDDDEDENLDHLIL
jgi:hypothetical protein